MFGGLTGYWTEESAALAASQPGFGRTILEAHKLTIYTTIPNELVHDAGDTLMDFANTALSAAVAFYEDVAFINGSGTGGYLNAPAAIKVSRTGGAGKVVFADVVNMYVRILPVAMHNAVWVCSPNVVGQLLQMAMLDTKSGTASVSSPVWLGTGWGASDRPTEILGHPLLVTEKHPALGSTGDLAFVNFDYYLLGDRMSMQLSSSEHYQFANDLLAVRLIERCDGRVWIQSPITPENGDSTLSPVVLLQ